MFQKAFFFVLFISLALLHSVPAHSQVNLAYFLHRGKVAFDNEKYTEAINHFNVVIERKNDPYEAYYYRGLAKFKLKDFQGAIFDFTQTLNIHPFHVDALRYRGVSYSAIMERGKAIDDLNRALEIKPNNARLFFSRGTTYLQMGNYDQAITDLNEAIFLDNKMVMAYHNRAIIYKEKDNLLKAIKDCNKVIELNEFYDKAYLIRGLIYYELNQFKDALRDFNQAIKIDENHSRYYYYRALTLYRLGDIEATLKNYSKVLELDPANTLTFYNRSIIYSQVQEYEKALYDLNRAAQLNPNNMLIFFQRAYIHAEMENYVFAVDDYSKVIQLFPKSARAYFLRADAKANAGNFEGARKDRNTGNQLLAAHDKYKAEGQAWVDSTYFSKIVEFEADFKSGELVPENNIPEADKIRPEKDFFFQILTNENIKGKSNPFVSSFNEKNEFGIKIFLAKEAKTDKSVLELLSNKVDSLITFSAPDAGLYFLKGIASHQLQNLSTAISNYKMAVATNPKFYPAYLNLAKALFEMQENSLAPSQNLENITLGKTSAPEEPKKTNYQRVLQELNQAVNINQNIAEAWYNRGNILLTLKSFGSAVQNYTVAIANDKDFAEAYYNRGLTLIYLQEKSRGCADMSKAGELGAKKAYEVIQKYCNE